MNVPGTKLGQKTDDVLDVLEVKVRPEYIGSLRKKDGILPAYHMNKEHWVSVLLSGPLTPKEIQELLADSLTTSFKKQDSRDSAEIAVAALLRRDRAPDVFDSVATGAV